MTKINKLVISGFKSFANKTEIHLGDNFNCILGPNGSGKSNVSDAICFVLGRTSSKSMRAEKTANLIFNGGKKKKEAKKGEVHIYFDNKNKIFPFDADEIKVSRIVTKKGLSKYKINDKTYTRSEVVDLLGAAKINPDGFNIILQGDITKFIEMSPNERRHIIEEVSGISLYEERKRKSLNELGKVNDKLNNAEIVLKERSTYLKELKKDRDQALRFKELKSKIDSNRATYLNLQIQGQTEKLNKLEESTGTSESKVKEITETISKLKESIEAGKLEIDKLNKEIELKGEKEQVILNKQITDLRVEITQKRSRIQTLKDELTKIDQRQDQLNEDLEEYKIKINQIEENKSNKTKELTQKEKEKENIIKDIEKFRIKYKINDVAQIEEQIEELDKKIEHEQEQIQNLRSNQHNLFRKKDETEFAINIIDQKVEKVKEIAKENKQKLDELKNIKSEFKQKVVELNKILDLENKYSTEIYNTRKTINSKQEVLNKLYAKTQIAQEKITQDLAVKKILEKSNTNKGIFGTVAQLGRVQSKYSLALEMAAGARTKSVIVDNDKTASDTISFLKQNRFGSASFIPLNKIKTREIQEQAKKLLSINGVCGFAKDLVTHDTKFKRAFSYVFGDTLVVDNLNVARRIGVGTIRMVTLEGDLVEQSGVMRGGYINKKIKGGAFKESDSMEEVQETEKDIQDLKSYLISLETKKRNNEAQITKLRSEKHELEGKVILLEKTLHLEDSDLDASKQKKKELQQELKQVEKELQETTNTISKTNRILADLKIKKQGVKGKIQELKNPRLQAQLTSYEEAKQQAQNDITKLHTEISNFNTQVKDLILPEKEKIESILKQLQKEKTVFKEEIKKISDVIQSEEKQLKEKEKQSKAFYSQYKELFNKRDKINSQIESNQSKIDALNEQRRSKEIELNKISLKIAEIKARLAGLNQEFEKFQGVPLLNDTDEDKLKREITKFEVLLSQMSAINMKALDIYESVQTEYQSLLEKKDILIKEKSKILNFMEEIEQKKKKQFLEIFENINNNFKKFFETLNHKGKAYLEIENKDDPFEGGVSVRVKLTGTRYLDIKSLSGGEKTMTALAFIFSIQEYQPHSFYILDEVDAALDKNNSEKLAKLVRHYVDRAQYLIISHNDAIISEADNLFGVSMDTDGISKVVSLKL